MPDFRYRDEAYNLTKLALNHDMGTEAEQSDAIESALRSAEARGRVQGKVQGLRDAADDAVNAPLPRFYIVQNDAVCIAAWLRERADAIEQEQTK